MKSFFRNFSPGLTLALAVITTMTAVFVVLIAVAPLEVALAVVLISVGLLLLVLHLGRIAPAESLVNRNIAIRPSPGRSTYLADSVFALMLRKVLVGTEDARDKMTAVLGWRMAMPAAMAT